MGASLASRHSDDEDADLLSDINVTPLVDVVLVLLIMFMIIVPTMLATAPINVELAANAAAKGKVPLDDLQILDLMPLDFVLKREAADNVLYVNGQRIGVSDLKGMIDNLKANGTLPSGKLSAQSGIPYGEVIRVVDLLTTLGMKDLALDTHAFQ